MRSDDTIAAIASAPGAAEIGVIRASGPRALELTSQLLGDESLRMTRQPTCRESSIDLARCGGRGRLTVQAYVWPTQRSYTGQPSVELRVLGAPPLLELVLEELFQLGARPAQRGEFTFRAFMAGRLDLAQADAVLGVIDAADFEQLQVALKQLAGGLSGLIGSARSELLNVLADLEAGLDFIDEDIEFIGRAELLARLGAVRQQIERLHQQAEQRMQSQHRNRVVLGGLPNAGKSTLFNALTGRDAAIVSEVSGTTRDYLSLPLQWDGIDIELLDTAGWMSSEQAIEQAAQQQRDDQLQRADLVLWCRAAVLSDDEAALDQEHLESLRASGNPLLVVRTKCDLLSPESTACSIGDLSEFNVSSRSGAGLAELRAHIVASLAEQNVAASELVGSTAARSRESLRATIESLDRAGQATAENLGDELVAIEIREALEHLGQIVGAVYTDDILDRIFSRFCIGK